MTRDGLMVITRKPEKNPKKQTSQKKTFRENLKSRKTIEHNQT